MKADVNLKPCVPYDTVHGYQVVITGSAYSERWRQWLTIFRRTDTHEFCELPEDQLRKMIVPAAPKVVQAVPVVHVPQITMSL
jgi:hypothetical protein